MKKWIKFKNVDNTDIALFIAAGAIIMLGLSYISVPLYQLFCQTYGIGGTVQKINYEQSIQNKIETLQNVHKGPQEVPKDTQNIQTSASESELNINYVRKINKLDKLDRDGALTEIFLKFYWKQIKLFFSQHEKPAQTSNYNPKPLTSPLPNGTKAQAGGDVTIIEQIKPITVYFGASSSTDLPWILKPSILKIKVYPGDTALTFYTAQNLSNQTLTGVATYNIVPAKAGVYFNKIQCFCFEEQRLKGKEFVELPVLFFIDSDFLKDPKMKDIDSITLSYTFFKTND